LVSCPVTPPGATPTGKPGNRRIHLLCEPSPPARVTHARNSTQKRTPPRKPMHARKRHPAHFVVFCRSI
jgi:hypothetical protein